MEMIRHSAGGGIDRRVGLKAAQEGAKHPAKKHPAKKHAAKKHAAKHQAKHPGKKAAKKSARQAQDDRLDKIAERQTAGSGVGLHGAEMAMAFHHLHRAGAVISLLEKESGGDLKMLLEHGMDLYRSACGPGRSASNVRCAFGLLRAAEHLGMAGLYTARSAYRAEVAPPPQTEVIHHLEELGPRLERLPAQKRENARRLEAMAQELLRKARAAGHDPHLEYELTMAADSICIALEEGL